MLVQCESGQVQVIRDLDSRNRPCAICDIERFLRLDEGSRALRAKERMITLVDSGMLSTRMGMLLRIGLLTQPPPFADLQFSAPTQRSADPESMRIRNTCGGVPICTSAKYPTSFALNLDVSKDTEDNDGKTCMMSSPRELLVVGLFAAEVPSFKRVLISTSEIPPELSPAAAVSLLVK